MADSPPFKVGDLVTSAYYRKDAKVVRRVTACIRGNSATGWLVSANGGEACPHCGNVAASIAGGSGKGIGSDWFARAALKT